jgi:hypothetical protein
MNPNAINLLLGTMCYIDWINFSLNPKAIDFLKANPSTIDIESLSYNPNAIELLGLYDPDEFDWDGISTNPNAINLIEQNLDKFVYTFGSSNPAIFEYDYNNMKQNKKRLHLDLIESLYHPNRVAKYLETHDDILCYLE